MNNNFDFNNAILSTSSTSFEGVKEKIIRCRDCMFFDKDQVACDRWDTVFPCPSASDEGQGFCAWAKRKTN